MVFPCPASVGDMAGSVFAVFEPGSAGMQRTYGDGRGLIDANPPPARFFRGAAFIAKRLNGFEPIRLLRALNDRGAREHGGCFRSGTSRCVTEQQPRGALHPLFVAIMRFLPLLSFTAYITRSRRVRVPSTRL